MNVKQSDMHLNGKTQRKASNITIYGYKNGQRGLKTLERYFIPSKVR